MSREPHRSKAVAVGYLATRFVLLLVVLLVMTGALLNWLRSDVALVLIAICAIATMIASWAWTLFPRSPASETSAKDRTADR